MWLLPVLSDLCRLASRAFYRLSLDGPAIPPEGPVLIVANHPNSLVDPVVVSGMAGRRVRFLAKAPLLTDRKLGWLVRATGAIPVYRRQDNVAAMDRNVDAFGAVIRELASGAAIGIFPEGISHSEPSLAELRTGTARMAIGTYEETGRDLPDHPGRARPRAQGTLSVCDASRARQAGSLGTTWPKKAGRTGRPCASSRGASTGDCGG